MMPANALSWRHPWHIRWRFPGARPGRLCLCRSSPTGRFVNGFVDAAQKGQYAMSVSQLAQKLSLPQHLVDLRHEASHNKLPSIQVLRMAARQVCRFPRL